MYAQSLLTPSIVRKRSYDLKIWSDAGLVYLLDLCISTLDFRLSENTRVTASRISQVAGKAPQDWDHSSNELETRPPANTSFAAWLSYMLQEKSKIFTSCSSPIDILLLQPTRLLRLKKSHVTRLYACS